MKNTIKGNEEKDLGGVASGSPRPAHVSIELDVDQYAAVRSLYEGRTVQGDGGIMFSVLGEVVIDEENRLDECGTATFYWLDDAQYTKVRAAIKEAQAMKKEKENADANATG